MVLQPPGRQAPATTGRPRPRHGIWHRWYGVQTPSGDRRVDTIMLSGNGGQKVYLVPSLDLIVVFTGGAFNVESPVNTMMAQVLLPALIETGASRQPRPNGR